MMCLMITLQLIFSISIVGVISGKKWSVLYIPENEACVLKGSEVVIHGAYKHPSVLKTVKFWVRNPQRNVEPADLTKDPEYSGRIQSFEESIQVSSLRLYNVTEQDEHMYCLRITTTSPQERYLGYPGVRLTVTELRVETPEHVIEGNTTHLTCKTGCRMSNTTAFLWFKNGQHIVTDSTKNVLSLKPTQKDDTGSYRCAVRGYEHLPSPAQTLIVRSGQNEVLYAGIGILIACFSLALVITTVVMRCWMKNRYCWSDGCMPTQNNNTAVQTQATDVFQSRADSANQNEVQYASTAHQKHNGPRPTVKASVSEPAQITQHCQGEVAEKTQEDIHYASVRFHPVFRSDAEMVQDPSVIYSDIKH